MQEKERMESYWLCSIKGIGAVSIRKLLQEAGSFPKIWNLKEARIRALLGDARAECLLRGMEEKNLPRVRERFYKMREQGIFVLPYGEEEYPFRLRELPDAPVLLYGKGRLPGREQKAAAVIGARECSVYGQEMAKYFAAGLAREGIAIISGMARGVDGLAQSAALYAGGCSAAVLGCGVDVCYPPENRKLYERLEKEGCLLSEYPPGTEPAAPLFPPRNRIISGLSDLVLVIEARERSGTLITVDMALEQGRDVFAVPGRITDRCSRGCNLLIRNGAGIAVSVAQLLEELKGSSFRKRSAAAAGEEEPDSDKGRDKDSDKDSDKGCGKVGDKGRDKVCEKIRDKDYDKTGGILPDTEKLRKAGALSPLGSRVLQALDWKPKSLDEIRQRLAAEDGEACPSLPLLMQELVTLCLKGDAENRAGMYYLKKQQ